MNRLSIPNWSASAGDYHSTAGDYIKLTNLNKKKAFIEKALISITIVGCLIAVSLIMFTH